MRLEVVGAGKNGLARRRHACLPPARPFSLAPTTSIQAPVTQAMKDINLVNDRFPYPYHFMQFNL